MRVNTIMCAKLLCGAKMKTTDHGVTAPLNPWSGMRRPWFLVNSPPAGGPNWSEYEVKVPALPRSLHCKLSKMPLQLEGHSSTENTRNALEESRDLIARCLVTKILASWLDFDGHKESDLSAGILLNDYRSRSGPLESLGIPRCLHRERVFEEVSRFA